MTIRSIFALVAALATAIFALAGGRLLADVLAVSPMLPYRDDGYFLAVLGSYLAAACLGFLVIRLVIGPEGSGSSLVFSAAILGMAVKGMMMMTHPGWFPAALLATLWLSWWLVVSRAGPAGAGHRHPAGERSTRPSLRRRAAGRS